MLKKFTFAMFHNHFGYRKVKVLSELPIVVLSSRKRLRRLSSSR